MNPVSMGGAVARKSSLVPIVVALVVVVGGAYLFLQNKSVNANAQEVLDQSITSALEMNSSTFAGNVDVDVKGEDIGGGVKLTYSGASEKSVLSSGLLSTEGMFKIGFDFGFDDEGEEMDGSGTIEAIIKDEVFYVKGVLSDDFLKQAPYITEFNDTWIKISLDEIKSSGIVPPEVLSQLDTQGLRGNQALQEKIVKLLVDTKVIKALSIKEGDKIDGKETYVVKVAVDPTKTGDFMLAYFKIVAEEMESASPFGEPTEEELIELEMAVAKYTKDIEFEATIEKETHFLRRGKFHLPIKDEDTKSIVSIDGSLSYDNINEPVEISAPAESTSIMEILAPFLGGMNPALR